MVPGGQVRGGAAGLTAAAECDGLVESAGSGEGDGSGGCAGAGRDGGDGRADLDRLPADGRVGVGRDDRRGACRVDGHRDVPVTALRSCRRCRWP